jgi:hypothetical protein
VRLGEALDAPRRPALRGTAQRLRCLRLPA